VINFALLELLQLLILV